MTDDQRIVNEVIREWMGGAGASATARSVLGLLQRLSEAYGESFSLDKACDALDNIARDAQSIKGNILQLQNKAVERVQSDPSA